MALVTNVREPGREQAGLPSRGDLPALALMGLPLTEPARNGFNLVQLDALQAQGVWVSNRPQPRAEGFGPGLRGVSNAALDTPWPKLQALKAALTEALHDEDPRPRLWAALSDTALAPEAALPATGLPPERERQLSAAFIRIPGPDGNAVYGTRASTLVLGLRGARGLSLQVIERSWSADGRLAGEAEFSFVAAT
jgi:uncharacterized protein with NRDE domain